MNVGTAHSEANPNTSYFNSRGMWVTYTLLVAILHYMCLSLPFLSVAWAWTLTHFIHNTLNFIILHMEKGTPFDTPDQASARYLTLWEQLDYGEQFTAAKKFLTIVPIVLFFLASFYTKYDPFHFALNAASLCLVLAAKLPMFHGVRIFGINKY